MSALRLNIFNVLLVSVLIVGILLVALAIVTVNVFDTVIVEQAAARNRHTEFLRAASALSEAVKGDLGNMPVVTRVVQDILQLRPGIRWLQVYSVQDGATTRLLSNAPDHVATLTVNELGALHDVGSLAEFDDSTSERAWIITAPLFDGKQVIGAIRGRFSISKYDELIIEQRELAKVIAAAAIILTSVVFLVLIRFQVHRPLAQLLSTMDRVAGGDMAGQAPVVGPIEIRRLAAQFNRMLMQITEGLREKERLLEAIRELNAGLEERVSHTIKELQKANTELMEAQIQAERNEKLAALGELSAVVAHELGNPLNAISGRLQMIAAATDTLEYERHLAIVKSEINRMVTTIRHVLDSTKVEARLSAIDLNETIQQVVVVVHRGSTTITTNLMPDPPAIAANGTMVHGMVFNLVMNALQAMPNGGTLTISTKLTTDEPLIGHMIVQGAAPFPKPAVRLTIEDSGMGMPEHVLMRLGEPFLTTRHHEGGTGLGVAICRRVVASSGGRFSVQSDVGKGSVFTIDLPVWNET